MIEIYVVTEFWDNGDIYDAYTTERPVKWFETLDQAREFCSNGNRNTLIKSGFRKPFQEYIERYNIEKINNFFDCPIGEDYLTCDEAFDIDTCRGCIEINMGGFCDVELDEYRIYKVSNQTE